MKQVKCLLENKYVRKDTRGGSESHVLWGWLKLFIWGCL